MLSHCCLFLLPYKERCYTSQVPVCQDRRGWDAKSESKFDRIVGPLESNRTQ